MFRWIAGRLRCFSGKHARSFSHVRKHGEGENYTSICEFCRVPMIRRAKRDWIVGPRR